jgi:hypothetical protein
MNPSAPFAIGVAISALKDHGDSFAAEIRVLEALRLVARQYHHADDLNEIVCTVPDCTGCATYPGLLAEVDA